MISWLVRKFSKLCAVFRQYAPPEVYVCMFDRKMDVGYFIEYAKTYREYIRSLELDHEPEEIEQQMKYYKRIMHNKADIRKWAHPALTRKDELKIDNMSDDEREKEFFGELEYADAYLEIYKNTFSKSAILEQYMKAYGCPSDVEERILKAEVAGDFGLASLYGKYRKSPGVKVCKG